MQKEIFTRFPYQAFYILFLIVISLPLYSYGQTPVVLPVPTQCDNGDPINLTDFVNDEDNDPIVIIPSIESLPEGLKMTSQGEISWTPSFTQFRKLKGISKAATTNATNRATAV